MATKMKRGTGLEQASDLKGGPKRVFIPAAGHNGCTVCQNDSVLIIAGLSDLFHTIHIDNPRAVNPQQDVPFEIALQLVQR